VTPFVRRAALGAAAAVLAHAAWCVAVPVGGPLRLVEVAPGTPVRGVARQLARAGVIRSAGWFVALARVTGRPLRAGEYGFERAAMWRVLRTLQGGRVYLHRVLVKEGDALRQIAEALDRARLADAARFRSAASDPGPLRALGVPRGFAEGFLFPDTYFLPRGMAESDIVALMVRRFFERVPRALIERAGERGLDLHRLVTLASIVEKEARAHEEREVIAGVFHRRLKLGMPLQADPTVLYGLHRWDRHLTRADLRMDSPYNTYRRAGLPPGPICSPGLACLKAAAEPADVPYLYFVTRKDGSGRHRFSRSLREHEAADRASRGVGPAPKAR
jgi:UPF0755 protein